MAATEPAEAPLGADRPRFVGEWTCWQQVALPPIPHCPPVPEGFNSLDPTQVGERVLMLQRLLMELGDVDEQLVELDRLTKHAAHLAYEQRLLAWNEIRAFGGNGRSTDLFNAGLV